MQSERPAQARLAFHASRIVIDVGVLVAMASMSMTFIVVDSGNRSALDADAFPVIVLLFPVFLITLIPDHTRPLHPFAGWAALTLGLTALPYAVVKMLDAMLLANTLDGSLGIGSRIMVIGCAVTLLGITIGLYRTLRGPPSRSSRRRRLFRTRSSSLAEPPRQEKSSATSAKPERSAAPESVDSDSTKLLPDLSELVTTPEPASPPVTSQPEIALADTGPMARKAEPESTLAVPDAAEPTDAPNDDHRPSLFDFDADQSIDE